MPYRLDQQSAGVAVAGLRDRPARVLLAGPMLGRHQPQARPRSSLRHNVVQSPISTHYANAASVPPRADTRACRRPARTEGRGQVRDLLVEAVAPEPDGEHRLAAVVKRRARDREFEHLPAKPRLVRNRPRPAVEHPPVAQQPASTTGGGLASDRHARAPARAPNPVLPHHARRAPSPRRNALANNSAPVASRLRPCPPSTAGSGPVPRPRTPPHPGCLEGT